MPYFIEPTSVSSRLHFASGQALLGGEFGSFRARWGSALYWVSCRWVPLRRYLLPSFQIPPAAEFWNLVVNSHWVADDEATAKLMQLFYKNLSEGMAKDEALQQAKLSFISTTDVTKQHPAFWGSFVVLGDTSPIVHPTFWQKYRWYLVLLFLLSLGIFMFLKKKKTRGYESFQ